MTPCFVAVYVIPLWQPAWFAAGSQWTVAVLWFLFIASEITDLIDGKVARARNEVSDFGKLFDPFADTLVWLAYFFCFVQNSLLPALLFLIIVYREFIILFIRNLMLKKGIAMGARKGGKIKAVGYMATGIVALLAESVTRLGLNNTFFTWLQIGATILFAVSVCISLISLVDYIRIYRKS
ncbi:CDP-diacylglycerol--glycerol-3-phosphate 3-phosphatidyltransferase [Spirochaetia bacterium]|nr:CDP-diacylglycerol--glycerol-3-phosphate 3-phosphatidyltransferase [Spirochaetia bacterium]